jgi:hypothetical protein
MGGRSGICVVEEWCRETREKEACACCIADLKTQVVEINHIPPLFLAPNLFPAPSFAELAAPWALCEAWRTAMVLLAKAGVDRRKADRAVSMVVMAGDEPVGSARILGSNMVELCVCGCAGVLCCRRFVVSLLQCSTFDFLPPPQLTLRI